MKLVTLSLAVLSMSVAAAHAESFSFAGTAKITSEIGGPVAGGKPEGASMSSGDTVATYASGKKVSSKANCAGWSGQPGDMFASHGLCVAEDGANKFSVAFSCQAIDAANTDCWARLTGMSGTYLNKIGMASWHGVRNGNTLTSAGTGQWN